MSKNFELLQNISNETDPFQALDRWEDTDEVSVNAGPGTEPAGKTRVVTQRQSALPDVFQAIDNSLGPFDPVPRELSRGVETAQEQAREPLEEKAQAETQSTPYESIPISRHPVSPLSSVLDIPQAWVKPEILPRPSDEVELPLDPETPPNVAVPDAPPTSEIVTGPSGRKVLGPSPAKEEKAHQQPPPREPLRNFAVDEGKSTGESRARKSQTRSAYRDPRRQAIAREEELKLVQRIFLAEENAPRVVLFSGFERETGCASICIRAGEMLASQGDGSVCLVDMGFRVPSLHEYGGVPNDRGLAEAMADANPIQEFAQQLAPANLWVIPSGQGAPQLIFAKVADRLRARMEELRKAFRYVIVHSGSLWLNADAMIISKWTDGVVLILEAHSTRRDSARRIKESLAVANARVLGVVLNNRTYPIPETLYSRL